METETAVFQEDDLSSRKAALIAGIGLLIMVLTVPFAEFQIFPKLINYKDPVETAQNISAQKLLFGLGIFLNFITILCDVVVAWALYVFLKPVNQSFSLLTAWFRLVYTGVYLMALMNLLKVFSLLKSETYFQAHDQGQASDLILFHVRSFGVEWTFGLILFGIYLLLLGFLVIKATYIPSWLGWLLVLAGIGYVVNSSGSFLFPTVNTDFLTITFVGELIFMVWLLVKGTRVAH